jgi:hypothetical protein
LATLSLLLVATLGTLILRNQPQRLNAWAGPTSPIIACREAAPDKWSAHPSEPEGYIEHGPLDFAPHRSGAWGAAKRTVDLQITSLLEVLWNPATIKNPKNTTFSVRSETPPLGTSITRAATVFVKLKPVFFITLEWQESWQLKELAAGQEYRISYQKTAGDDRLSHFCGWMHLKKISDRKTLVSMYEEVVSSHRTPEEVSRGRMGTIITAQKILQQQTPSTTGN